MDDVRGSLERRYTEEEVARTGAHQHPATTSVKVITVAVAFGPHILSTFREFLSRTACEKATVRALVLHQILPSPSESSIRFPQDSDVYVTVFINTTSIMIRNLLHVRNPVLKLPSVFVSSGVCTRVKGSRIDVPAIEQLRVNEKNPRGCNPANQGAVIELLARDQRGNVVESRRTRGRRRKRRRLLPRTIAVATRTTTRKQKKKKKREKLTRKEDERQEAFGYGQPTIIPSRKMNHLRRPSLKTR
ncbi:hypothetical protein ANTRET_LOCUS5467 [Anthophora retusa]